MTRARANLALRLVAVGVLGALGALGTLAACGDDRGAFQSDDTAVPEAGAKKEGGGAADATEPELDGAADADADAVAWPTCATKPATAAARTIPAIWQANPAAPSETWVEGAYVTAISGSACRATKACQIFVQSDPSYASLGAASKHGIKIFVSGSVAARFTSLRVGDRVDVVGWAWRYNLDQQNELLLQVNSALPGCAKTSSTGNVLTPVSGVTLPDLTLDKYENTHGPMLVRVASVLGKPDPSPTSTFGLFHLTDSGLADAGAGIVSLSPFMLPSATFTGLSPTLTAFASITGVFGTFVPSGGPKYLELYPRTMADVVPQ